MVGRDPLPEGPVGPGRAAGHRLGAGGLHAARQDRDRRPGPAAQPPPATGRGRRDRGPHLQGAPRVRRRPERAAGPLPGLQQSRDRFVETLEILRKAWTQERFSHEGKYFQFNDVCIMPKPYQKPPPPIRSAATTPETYPMVAQMGAPVFVAVRTVSITDLKRHLPTYQAAWTASGRPGRGNVGMSVPLYVAETARQAREEAEASTMHFFRSISKALKKSDGATAQTTEARAARANRLSEITYDEILSEYAVFGSADEVVDRLSALREEMGFSTISTWMNPGGLIPNERVLKSMRLFAERVAPRLA